MVSVKIQLQKYQEAEEDNGYCVVKTATGRFILSGRTDISFSRKDKGACVVIVTGKESLFDKKAAP